MCRVRLLFWSSLSLKDLKELTHFTCILHQPVTMDFSWWTNLFSCCLAWSLSDRGFLGLCICSALNSSGCQHPQCDDGDAAMCQDRTQNAMTRWLTHDDVFSQTDVLLTKKWNPCKDLFWHSRFGSRDRTLWISIRLRKVVSNEPNLRRVGHAGICLQTDRSQVIPHSNQEAYLQALRVKQVLFSGPHCNACSHVRFLLVLIPRHCKRNIYISYI